jgi:hypothetical protein
VSGDSTSINRRSSVARVKPTWIAVVVFVFGVSACNADEEPSAPSNEGAGGDDGAGGLASALAASCRKWCATEALLASDCEPGAVIVDGHFAGDQGAAGAPAEPMPSEGCGAQCAKDATAYACVQQKISWNDCMADAFWVCDGTGWVTDDCLDADSPSVCE